VIRLWQRNERNELIMKSYFVETTDTGNLQTALGRMIEYAKFLEKESGRSNENYVDEILNDESIKINVVNI
jgi:hypothetical protein